jgi:N-hydroxyarylamine O-acetyltransferase
MHTAAYVARIGYHGPLGPTADTLRQLQVAHLLSVPFENLSIHSGEPVLLEDEALFEKIVTRRRGGFCYELNGLFAWLLRSLGFRVTMLAADVMNARGEWGLPFDHMALLVTLEDRWLVDVGFGDSFVEPLRLEPCTEQPQGRGSYRLDLADGRFVVMRRGRGGSWTAQYRFDLTPYEYADYEEMCRYHQTSPESHFTQNRVCSLATRDGRITISGTRLIRTTDDDRQEWQLSSQADYVDALREHFGIHAVGPGNLEL